MTRFANWTNRRKRRSAPKPGSGPPRGRACPFVRLRFEHLEDRIQPATITWTNPAGGSWHSPGNWDLNRVPAAGDSVVIPDLAGAQTISYSSGGTSIQSL